MRIIEIQTLENGSHRNQTGNFINIPEGWAVIPDDIDTPNFPFGEIETKDEDVIGVEYVEDKEAGKPKRVEKVIGIRKVVTKWIAGTIPEPEPIPDPEPTAEDKLNALVGGMSYE